MKSNVLIHSCWQSYAMAEQWLVALAWACFLLVPAVAVHGSDPGAPPSLADMEQWVITAGSVSGYMTPVHLVTTRNVMFDGGPRLPYDPGNGDRDIYRRIWKR